MRFLLREWRYRGVYRRYKSHTMVHPDLYCDNLHLATKVSAIEGSIVECGTWRGGMIAGIADVLGGERKYYLCDSFEGLPPATEADGTAAKSWQADTTSPSYYDNCTAREEDARAAMSMSSAKDYTILRGWFQDTLPAFPLGPIALLRMDADWYESTKCILEQLAHRVVRDGVIIVDDYYTWEGCALAVNEYAARNKWRVRQSARGVCYLIV